MTKFEDKLKEILPQEPRVISAPDGGFDEVDLNEKRRQAIVKLFDEELDQIYKQMHGGGNGKRLIIQLRQKLYGKGGK